VLRSSAVLLVAFQRPRSELTLAQTVMHSIAHSEAVCDVEFDAFVNKCSDPQP
jgi:hypothetical protein